MLPKWVRIQTVLEGTDSLREARETYLPKHEAESDPRYEERLNGSILFNMVDLTLRTWVGKPFQNKMRYSDDFSPELKPLMEDVDLQGNDLWIFARKWFREGVAKAFCHVLIDFPRIDPAGRTAADDDREGVRPYFVKIDPENVTFMAAERINNKEVLTHVRILESVTMLDGWEEVSVTQYRVLDRVVRVLENGQEVVRVQVTLWQQQVVEVSANRKETKWVVVDTWDMDIDEIPLVTYYADRTGLMEGKPCLDDQAHLNIRHWQSTSDQISVLTVSRFPILAGAGVDEDETGGKNVIGPYRALTTADPGGKWYYVEHSGAAIQAGKQDLDDLEARMKSYGAEFMKARPSRETASARVLDSAEAASPLQDAVARFNDVLAYALYFMGKWLGIEVRGRVEIPTDFGSLDANDILMLNGARERGDLARVTYLKVLQQNGKLPNDFDYAANEAALKKEQETNVRSAEKQRSEGPDGRAGESSGAVSS
jgi:hypothetical protein